MAYGILVREVMTHNPVIIGENKTVMDTVKLMLKNGVGSVIVVDKSNEMKGIFTEKDLISKVVVKSVDPKKTKVSEVMSKKVITIDPWLDLEDAADLMNTKQVRRLPVIDKGKLMGIITAKDMLRTEPQIIDMLKERLLVKEPSSKPIYDNKRFESGVCEVCSNFTDKLQYSEGMWLCEHCLREVQ